MNGNTFPRLLGDVGGTHARFTWQEHAGAPFSDTASYLCAEHASLRDAIERYLGDHGRTTPRGCAIGIANPVTGDQVRMTNHHWAFSIDELRRALGVHRLIVVNDFTALAWSLPRLRAAELHAIGPGTLRTDLPLAVLGPGTGLGMSGLLPSGRGGRVAIEGEGGHVTLAAGDEREAAVMAILQRRFGHVSAERAISGPGLVHLYEACAELAGTLAQAAQAAEVIARARAGSDPQCSAALGMFCGLLGSVAGNLALTLGARGGVFIGGGIAPRLLDELRRSSFRERFESKGRFRDYLQNIPTLVIDATAPAAFTGAGLMLDAMDPCYLGTGDRP